MGESGEVDRNGTAVWEWNARNHFVFGGEAGAQFVQFNVNSTTVEFPLDASTPLVNASTYHFHVNDADRLANGNTLICMRDLNLVVEVERDGNIAWFFGNPGNTTTLKWPHNPVRLINGNTIICDSGNNRIIEVMPAKEMVWSTQSFPWIQLQFPKGAERLPNGNTLISDAYNNRNIEITSSGTIVWSFPGQLTYDADRIDRFAPDIVAAVLAVEQGKSFSIQLSGTILAADLDEAWYNVFDETRGEWLFNDMQLAVDFNQTFTLHEGNFTVHVWARDTRAGCVMDSSDFNPNVNHVLFTIALEFTPPSPLLAYIILLSSAGGASVVVFYFLRLHIIRKKDAASLAEEMKARADPASKDFTTDVTLDFDTDIPS